MRVLVACEFSGVVRDAFRARGHDAWSCDILPAEDEPIKEWLDAHPEYEHPHFQEDALVVAHRGLMTMDSCPNRLPWDLIIAHPPCTRLTNSGVRWLHIPPPGKTKEQMWRDLDEACAFYLSLRAAPIPRKAIENPVMHKYARERLGAIQRHVVQPWWFGEPEFKATGWELHGLPPLVATNKLTPPAKGTPEHAAWSKVHRCSPGPNRWKERSRTLKGVAAAMSEQWGGTP